MPTEVTTIPDEPSYPSGDGRDDMAGGRRDASERIERVGRRAEETTGRIAAAIAGALEGFVEALERYDVANEGQRAIRNAGELSRAAAVEGSTQARSPEMRQVGEQVRAAGTRVGEATGAATDRVRATAEDARESVHDAVESAKHAAYRVKEGATVRAEALAETGRRARAAPRHIADELSEAFGAWRRALMTSLAMFAALTIFSAIALIVLTIALVVGLNELLGDPAGTFVVALIYVVVAGIAWGVARTAKTRAALEREERMENVREEVRHVVRPVRDAFSRGRAG